MLEVAVGDLARGRLRGVVDRAVVPEAVTVDRARVVRVEARVVRRRRDVVVVRVEQVTEQEQPLVVRDSVEVFEHRRGELGRGDVLVAGDLTQQGELLVGRVAACVEGGGELLVRARVDGHRVVVLVEAAAEAVLAREVPAGPIARGVPAAVRQRLGERACGRVDAHVVGLRAVHRGRHAREHLCVRRQRPARARDRLREHGAALGERGEVGRRLRIEEGQRVRAHAVDRDQQHVRCVGPRAGVGAGGERDQTAQGEFSGGRSHAQECSGGGF